MVSQECRRQRPPVLSVYRLVRLIEVPVTGGACQGSSAIRVDRFRESPTVGQRWGVLQTNYRISKGNGSHLSFGTHIIGNISVRFVKVGYTCFLFCFVLFSLHVYSNTLKELLTSRQHR